MINEYDFLKNFYIPNNFLLTTQHRKYENNTKINTLIYQEQYQNNFPSIMIQFIEDTEYFERRINTNLIIRESYVNNERVMIFSKNMIETENGILYAIFQRDNFSFCITTNELNKEEFLAMLQAILK